MKLGEKEKEFTFLQIDVKGNKNGKDLLHRYKMYDKRDDKTGYTSWPALQAFPA